MRGNGLASIDILLAFEASRGQFIGPGKDQDDGKTEDDQEGENPMDPFRGQKCWQDNRGDLDGQPADHRVSGGHAEYVPTLEFGEEAGHRQSLQSVV